MDRACVGRAGCSKQVEENMECQKVKGFLERVFRKSYASKPSSMDGLADKYPNSYIDRFFVSELITGAILDRRPFFAGRLGWFECSALGSFHKNGFLEKGLMAKLESNAGLFPNDASVFLDFKKIYLEALGVVDLVGLLKSPHEENVLNASSVHSLKCELGCLEPYLAPNPWSRSLSGKRVLVIHPFVKSIRNQYSQNRSKIFANPDVLPEFELLCLKPPQTFAGSVDGFSSWTEALDATKEKVAALQFDVAIIGCGAYGFPLGAFVKSLGGVGIHLGGATQLLFGILGKRWTDVPSYQPIFRSIARDAWIRPSESERPPNWQIIEGGCYW
jgi:hypothetical protein